MPKIFLRLLHRVKSHKLERYFVITFFIICAAYKYLTYKPTDYVPKHLETYLRFGENYTSPGSRLSLAALGAALEERTARREVRNWRQFGPVRRDTPVLSVLCARDAARLQLLVLSLAEVRHIHTVLLVFSHSFFDENVDELIESINFCMVLQIYFPNSRQLYPSTFPGDEAGGRDARRAEGKHHWWWTAHVVFERLPWARAHVGPVLFLREASYVLPDLLHVLRFARAALRYVPEAEVLSFGRPLADDLDYDKLTVDAWGPPYDEGLTFNLTVWRKIKSLSPHFCEYDDASWGHSLLYALQKSRHGHAVMVACEAPRVVATGAFASWQRARETALRATRRAGLFPPAMAAVALSGRAGPLLRPRRASRGAGGWDDLRDHLLCLDPTAATGTTDDSTSAPPVFDVS